MKHNIYILIILGSSINSCSADSSAENEEVVHICEPKTEYITSTVSADSSFAWGRSLVGFEIEHPQDYQVDFNTDNTALMRLRFYCQDKVVDEVSITSYTDFRQINDSLEYAMINNMKKGMLKHYSDLIIDIRLDSIKVNGQSRYVWLSKISPSSSQNNEFAGNLWMKSIIFPQRNESCTGVIISMSTTRNSEDVLFDGNEMKILESLEVTNIAMPHQTLNQSNWQNFVNQHNLPIEDVDITNQMIDSILVSMMNNY